MPVKHVICVVINCRLSDAMSQGDSDSREVQYTQLAISLSMAIRRRGAALDGADDPVAKIMGGEVEGMNLGV